MLAIAKYIPNTKYINCEQRAVLKENKLGLSI